MLTKKFSKFKVDPVIYYLRIMVYFCQNLCQGIQVMILCPCAGIVASRSLYTTDTYTYKNVCLYIHDFIKNITVLFQFVYNCCKYRARYGIYSLKSTSNDKFLESFHCNFLYSQRSSHGRHIFLNFILLKMFDMTFKLWTHV